MSLRERIIDRLFMPIGRKRPRCVVCGSWKVFSWQDDGPHCFLHPYPAEEAAL